MVSRHCGEHAYFRSVLRDLTADFENGRTSITVPLIEYLVHWLLHHIAVVDRAMARLLTTSEPPIAERVAVALKPHMNDELSDSERHLLSELRRANDELEKQVSERTETLALRTNELELANRRLSELADVDGLTGVANRRKLEFEMDGAWAASKAADAHLALLLIDVDHFKQFNDTWGHQTGDQIIRFVATTLRRFAPPGGLAARYGGEEFAVIIPDAPAGVHAELAARLVAAVAELGIVHEKNCDWGVVTISVGASCFEPAAGEIKQIFRQADQFLYKAKGNGRNRVEWLE